MHRQTRAATIAVSPRKGSLIGAPAFPGDPYGAPVREIQILEAF